MEDKAMQLCTDPGTYSLPDSIPPFFRQLASRGCLAADDIFCTDDRFYAVSRSIADILVEKGITTFPNSRDEEWDCDKFFDDWYLYAVPGDSDYIYSLFKMREQEFDAANGLTADGDTPGVTVSFIMLETEALSRCIDDPSFANRKTLGREINRVVADRGQRHHAALKTYFNDYRTKGSYLIGQLYVHFLASLAQNGTLVVPESYKVICQKVRTSALSRMIERIPRFIDRNNEAAEYTVCDHKKIYIRNPGNLSLHEKLAILAIHTADVSFASFAAEVEFHARFLTWYAKIPIPFFGRSFYDSAIRADMSIDESSLENLAPFHCLRSRIVRRQARYHHKAEDMTLAPYCLAECSQEV